MLVSVEIHVSLYYCEKIPESGDHVQYNLVIAQLFIYTNKRQTLPYISLQEVILKVYYKKISTIPCNQRAPSTNPNNIPLSPNALCKDKRIS